MFRGSNPGLVIGIFLRYFIISVSLAPSGPLSGESTFHYHQFKITDLLNFLAFIMRCLYGSVNGTYEEMCVDEACFGLSIAGVFVGTFPFAFELCQSLKTFFSDASKASNCLDTVGSSYDIDGCKTLSTLLLTTNQRVTFTFATFCNFWIAILNLIF
jgi:hypothetical protein